MPPSQSDPQHAKRTLWSRITAALGPGFITGAADDDPSGIATYSQTGLQFGYTQLWAALFSYPFMTTMQEMCGRIGIVTGDGLADIVRRHYPKWILYGAVFLLFFANTINIGADLGAMAAAVQLVLPLPFVGLLFVITLFTVFLQIAVPYPSYSRFLKWLALSLLAYVATAFVVKEDWGKVLSATFIPHVEFTKAYLLNIAAFLGTTISPYLFFWQADEEVEEEIEQHKISEMGAERPEVSDSDITDMRIDTGLGMFFSNAIAYFIMITVATTLANSGLTSIESAADAANALKPVAGQWAFLLFTIGILGTGLLAVPVLAGSAGYAISEAFQWKVGLGKRFGQAKGFYVVIALSTVLGVIVNFTGIGSMKMLYYAAMLNGVLAPPLMILILLIANNERIMGPRKNGLLSNLMGWLITIIMSGIAIALLWTSIFS